MKLQLTYSPLRRAFFPIYGVDQFVFALFIPTTSLLICWLIGDYGPFPLMTLFGYAGFVLTMGRSSPASLEMSLVQAEEVVGWLNRSPFLCRKTDETWAQRKPGVLRWSSDTLRIERREGSAILRGRYIDLFKAKTLFDGDGQVAP